MSLFSSEAQRIDEGEPTHDLDGSDFGSVMCDPYASPMEMSAQNIPIRRIGTFLYERGLTKTKFQSMTKEMKSWLIRDKDNKSTVFCTFPKHIGVGVRDSQWWSGQYYCKQFPPRPTQSKRIDISIRDKDIAEKSLSFGS